MNSLQGAYSVSVSAPAASRQRPERIHELPTELSCSFRENGAVSPTHGTTRSRGMRGPWSEIFGWAWPLYGRKEGGSDPSLSSWVEEAGTNEGTRQNPGIQRHDPQSTCPSVKTTQTTHHPGMLVIIMEREREVDRIRGGCCPGWNGWARLSLSKDSNSQVGIQIPGLQDTSPVEQPPPKVQTVRQKHPEEQSQDEKSQESPAPIVGSTPTTDGISPMREADSVAEGSTLVAPQEVDPARGIESDQVLATNRADQDASQDQVNPQTQVRPPNQPHSTATTPAREDPAAGTGEPAEQR